jgi:hypothetical protein
MVVSVEQPDDCGVGAIEEVKIEKRLKETSLGVARFIPLWDTLAVVICDESSSSRRILSVL